MLSVSILGIKDNVDKLISIDKLNPEYIHLDIMDGFFVNNITDMSNLPNLNTPKDVHLMVRDVKKYIDIYKKYNPEYITFHLEVDEDIDGLIDYIHSLGIKVGISIKPNTEVLELDKYLNKIDLVLIMSVEPGKGGQTFLMNSISKVELLDQLRKENGYQYLIEIDGGINAETKKIVPLCDIFVVGSYITSSDDYQSRLSSLK